MAVFGFVIPSDAVPGDDNTGLDRMHRRKLGGEGLDRVSLLSFEVPDVILKPWIVISTFLRVCFVSCTVPPPVT